MAVYSRLQSSPSLTSAIVPSQMHLSISSQVPVTSFRKQCGDCRSCPGYQALLYFVHRRVAFENALHSITLGQTGQGT